MLRKSNDLSFVKLNRNTVCNAVYVHPGNVGVTFRRLWHPSSVVVDGVEVNSWLACISAENGQKQTHIPKTRIYSIWVVSLSVIHRLPGSCSGFRQLVLLSSVPGHVVETVAQRKPV